jgi:uncharacterized protein (TIGR02145 family)
MKKIILVLFFSGLLISLSGQEKFTDSRDGNVYKTITVQGVTWMAENLRFKAKEGAYSFDKDPNNVPIYGVLYDWKTALKVCPDGWHLPSGAEFQILANYNDQKDSWKLQASEPTSFGIQLAGMQDYEGTFSEMDESAYFWTSNEYDKENAEYFSYLMIVEHPVADLSRKADIADIHGTEKTNKYSVRCVKN